MNLILWEHVFNYTQYILKECYNSLLNVVQIITINTVLTTCVSWKLQWPVIFQSACNTCECGRDISKLHPVHYIEIHWAGRKYRHHVWKLQKITVVTECLNVIHWYQSVVFSNKNTVLVLYLHISIEHIYTCVYPGF